MDGRYLAKLLAQIAFKKALKYLISLVGGTTLLVGFLVIVAVLAVYGALPSKDGSPLSLGEETKNEYIEVVNEYNPPIKSSNKEEKKYLLTWGFVYAFDLFRAQALGANEVENRGKITASVLKPSFEYKQSTVTVRTKDKDGKTKTSKYTVTLLKKAITYQGIYIYHYKWKQTERVTKEVLDHIEYIEDWRRFDDYFIETMNVKEIDPRERPMIINAGIAFTQGKENVDWMGREYALKSNAVIGQVSPDLIKIFKEAAERFGVPEMWYYFLAVAKVENSNFDENAIGSPNYTGELAQGLMQILPSTFKKYGYDGNGDGQIEPFNAEDSIYTAVNYLVSNNIENNLRGAIYLYNHSTDYVNKVIELAESFKMQEITGSIADYCFPVGGQWSYTSYYGDDRKKEDGATYGHQGVDIGTAEGTDLYAFTSGKVRITHGYYGGNELWIDALDGASYYYAHMYGYAVSNGDDVMAGDLVGYVGKTGPAWKITGPHLHFGIMVNGDWVDPLLALENSRGGL